MWGNDQAWRKLQIARRHGGIDQSGCIGDKAVCTNRDACKLIIFPDRNRPTRTLLLAAIGYPKGRAVHG